MSTVKNQVSLRFAYVRTDSEGYATYSYMRSYNGQTLTYYLHFYDEGVFYNGFWVVNDLETGFVETTGRVFIYNSENDYCPEVSITNIQKYNTDVLVPIEPKLKLLFFRQHTTTGTSGRMEIGFTTLASICKPVNLINNLFIPCLQ